MVEIGGGARSWRLARGVQMTDADGGVAVRHQELNDDVGLGVVIPNGSWVLELLAFLKTSRGYGEIAARFPSTALPKVLLRLQRNGLIHTDEAREDAFLAKAHALAVARRAMRLAALARTGGRSLSERAVSAEATSALARVRDMADELAKIVPLLECEQRGLVRDAAAALGGAAGRRLHLGCGRQFLDGWTNIDTDSGDLQMDLRDGLPFSSGGTDFVYCAHVLEHLTFPAEAVPLAREMHRVLRPGGVVRFVVPDIALCLSAYARSDDEFFTERARHWTWARDCHTPLAQFLEYVGANRSPFDMTGHKYGYDFETLTDLLERTGNWRVRRCTYQGSNHPDLRVDDRSLGARYKVGDVHLSLFVEATKI